MSLLKTFFLGPSEPDDIYFSRQRELDKKRIAGYNDKQVQLSKEEYNKLKEKIKLEDSLCSLEDEDVMFAVSCAMLSLVFGENVDLKGKNIESWINKRNITINEEKIKIKDFDTNNPFDFVSGSEHRKMMFHDGNLLKKINADFVLRDGRTIEDFMKGGESSYTLLELIVKRYDLPQEFVERFLSVAKIILVHYAKDVVTPDGIPFPFTSCFTKERIEEVNTCGYAFENSFYSKLREYGIRESNGKIKASDITAYIISKAAIWVYVERVSLKRKYTDIQKKNFARLMKITAWTIMLCIQLLQVDFLKAKNAKISTIIIPEMVADYFLITKEVLKNHKDICNWYTERAKILERVDSYGA